MKIDFETAKKDLPITRGELAKRIAETPLNIVLDYVQGLKTIKGQLDQYIEIMHAANSPCCDALLDQVTDDKLHDLELIVEILNGHDVLDRIDQLQAASMGSNPSKKRVNKEKINELLEAIKKLDQYKLENIAGACINLQQEQANLSTIILFYLSKKRNDIALKRYLGKIDEKSIDIAISTCSTLEKVYENIT